MASIPVLLPVRRSVRRAAAAAVHEHGRNHHRDRRHARPPSTMMAVAVAAASSGGARSSMARPAASAASANLRVTVFPTAASSTTEAATTTATPRRSWSPSSSPGSVPRSPESTTGRDDGVGGDGGGTADIGGVPGGAATLVRGPSLLTGTGTHRPSPSMFHLPGLRSLPFWTRQRPSPRPSSSSSSSSGGQREDSGTETDVAFQDPTITRIVRHVEGHADGIREEYLSNVVGRGTGSDYDVGGRGGEHSSDALHTGKWDWHSYVLNGEKQASFARQCPLTSGVLDEIGDDLFLDNPFAFAFFSTLNGGSSIKPHTGPMNLRLRFHLPLLVPATAPGNSGGGCGIRVGGQGREWVEGRALVLDDSYEHEVWNDTSEPRVLLLFDVWHPDVRPEERERIRRMFRYAKEQGWIGGKGQQR